MKFGKEFKKKMVPEWAEAYMDYNGLKRILRELREYKQRKHSRDLLDHKTAAAGAPPPNRTISGIELQISSLQNTNGDIEDQVIDVNTLHGDGCRQFYKTKFLKQSEEGGEIEVTFFRKLDEELNKVNTFYKDKVKEVKQEANHLDKQMEALVALRIKVKNRKQYGSNSNSKRHRNSAVPLTSNKSSAADASGKCRRNEPMGLTSENEKHQREPSPGASEVNPTHIKNPGSDDREVLNIYDYQEDPLEVLEHVKIKNTLESPISTIKCVFKDSREEELSFDKEELKRVEERLRAVFIQFYHKLQLLKHYSFMNLSAFSKIMKKYEKITSRRAARSYMLIVDNSDLGSSDEVTNLLERAEATFIQNFSNSNRREGMKSLRPKAKREKHGVTVFSGTELGYREVFLLSSGLAVLALGGLLANLHLDMDSSAEKYKTLTELVPLGLLICYLSLCSWSLPSPSALSTSYTVQVVSSSFGAYSTAYVPLFTRRHFPDFFLADQLTSQVQALRSFVLYICCYGLGEYSRRQTKCHSHGVYNTLYFIIAVIPFWMRFLQVLNVVLRLAWMQLVLEFKLSTVHKMTISTIIAFLEVIRRGIWSFFRLENEHLNNAGEYRAFKSVPLPFSYYDEDADKDERT
ncbi:hypothetical protein ACE6H2_002911 [Prunus campanulata]